MRAPAKVNLYLQVLRRRPDGYHEIQTVMQTVSLCDEISFQTRDDGRILLHCSEPELSAGDDNLVVRAAKALKESCGVEVGVEAHLTKRIPIGAGLGGGSSDCAAALLALRRLWRLEMDDVELGKVAAQLGSDVPFFLRWGTALCRGRGEKVAPVRCACTLYYTLVMPGFGVATSSVYAAVRKPLTKDTAGIKKVLAALKDGDVDKVGRSLRNDLQPPALALYESLGGLLRELAPLYKAAGGCGVLLCGSGSSYFLLHRTEREAEDASKSISRELQLSCASVRTLMA